VWRVKKYFFHQKKLNPSSVNVIILHQFWNENDSIDWMTCVCGVGWAKRDDFTDWVAILNFCFLHNVVIFGLHTNASLVLSLSSLDLYYNYLQLRFRGLFKTSGIALGFLSFKIYYWLFVCVAGKEYLSASDVQTWVCAQNQVNV